MLLTVAAVTAGRAGGGKWAPSVEAPPTSCVSSIVSSNLDPNAMRPGPPAATESTGSRPARSVVALQVSASALVHTVVVEFSSAPEPHATIELFHVATPSNDAPMMSVVCATCSHGPPLVDRKRTVPAFGSSGHSSSVSWLHASYSPNR